MLHYNSKHDEAAALAARFNEIRQNSAATAQADLSRLADVEALSERVTEWAPSLDLLVNNASRFYPTRTGETLAWQWQDLLNSNLRGPYFLVQGLLEPLTTAGGSVVNIIDVHAERPMQGHAVYCISKAGLSMMTRSLAQELGPAIRVNGVSPGAILWPENEPDSQQKSAILERTALARLGDPGDIAGAVCYLALDAPYVTGQVLAVDGGRSLNM
jgi:pteridine reductase